MAAGKKLVDTFKAKGWYHIVAPKFLAEAEVGQVPALDEEHLLNRVIIVPLKEITKDIGHMYTAVKLRVFEIKGKTAHTKFIGHAVSREYLRTLVRRRRDVINLVFSVKSKDDLEFRIKVVVVTNNLCSDRLKTAMRHLVEQTLAARARETDFGGFIQDTLYGKVGNEVTAKLRKLASIRRVEISKTTLKEEFDTEDVIGIQKSAGDEAAGGESGEAKAEAAAPAAEDTPQAATHA